MRSIAKLILLSGAALFVGATSASAAIVCNDDGDCWHVKGHMKYKPELKLHVHNDNWKWKDHDKYKWHEHEGHGYWRSGVWIDLGQDAHGGVWWQHLSPPQARSFSRRTMEEHWQTGYSNARQTLTNREVLQLPDRLEGVRTFDCGESQR